MSQKKPTTNQQLAEMREMIAELQPGQIISIDRELQRKNTTLELMLYGAAAKFGVGLKDSGNGVICTAQLPVMQVPANHQLRWEVAEDGASVMLYIVLADSPEESHEADSTAEGEGGGETVDTDGVETSPSPDPGEDIDDDEFSEVIGVGDEFEDEIKVGMDD